MLTQDDIDIIMKEIEEADGDVEFREEIYQEPVDDRNIAEWFWDEVIKFFWLR